MRTNSNEQPNQKQLLFEKCFETNQDVHIVLIIRHFVKKQISKVMKGNYNYFPIFHKQFPIQLRLIHLFIVTTQIYSNQLVQILCSSIKWLFYFSDITNQDENPEPCWQLCQPSLKLSNCCILYTCGVNKVTDLCIYLTPDLASLPPYFSQGGGKYKRRDLLIITVAIDII